MTPLPTAVDAPIQIVWPRDPRTANITALLLQPGTSDPVPCRWTPTVRLLSSIDGGPSARLMTGAKRMVTANGLTYAVWDFNGVDISAALQGKSIDFWLDVDGVATHATRVTYTESDADARADGGRHAGAHRDSGARGDTDAHRARSSCPV